MRERTPMLASNCLHPARALVELTQHAAGRRSAPLAADVTVDPDGRAAALSLEDSRHIYQLLLSTQARDDGTLHVDLHVERSARNASRRGRTRLRVRECIGRGQRVVLARLRGRGGFELALTVR